MKRMNCFLPVTLMITLGAFTHYDLDAMNGSSIYSLDPLAFKLAAFTLFLALAGWTMKRMRWFGEVAFLASVQSVSTRAVGSGRCCAKLPFITSKDGSCPLFRSILMDDLHLREITEISGGSDHWWDFTYRKKRFTCRLLPKSCHGSELYRSGEAPCTEEEEQLLQELAYRIAWNAARKTGLTCHSLVCI